MTLSRSTALATVIHHHWKQVPGMMGRCEIMKQQLDGKVEVACHKKQKWCRQTHTGSVPA